MSSVTCRPTFRNVAVVLTTTVILGLGLVVPASAGYTQRSASDQMSQSLSIPVTDGANGAILPSVLMVQGAQLDTTNSLGTHAQAPPGMIFLTLQATSGPEQRSYGQANYGHFFSGMTPLAESAVTFTSHAGRVYVSTRSNPINQTYNPNSASDDGLLDATYWFLVPISTRTGTITIRPTSTQGVEYTGFVGGQSSQLKIGGPTSFTVSFPKKLNVTSPSPRLPSSSQTSSASHNSFNELFTVLAWLVIAIVFIRWLRRRRRTHSVATNETPPMR